MAYMSFLYERLAHDMPLWMQDGSGIDSLLKAGDEMYGDNEAERVGATSDALTQRSAVLEAEARRLAGERAYGISEVRRMLKRRLASSK